MNKNQMLLELPKLTPEERNEIRRKLAQLDDGSQWLDTADPLTPAEKALLEERLIRYENDSDAGSTWEEVEARVASRLRR